MGAPWSPFLFFRSFDWVTFLARLVVEQGVGASVLRLTSRAAGRVHNRFFVNVV